MTVFDYSVAPVQGARLGLVVLQPDETIEQEFRHFLPAETVALHVARIPSAPEVSRATLARMEADLPRSAALLPPAVRFDAVGYGCTSGTSVIGAPRVSELISGACRTAAVTNPLSALLAAAQALGVTRLALLSPYVESVSDGVRRTLAAQGVVTPVFGSFNEAEESRVARIDDRSICAAVETLAAQGNVQALFLSCTNLRTRGVIRRLEARTGLPVLASNQVLAWHMMRLAKMPATHPDFGRLGQI